MRQPLIACLAFSPTCSMPGSPLPTGAMNGGTGKEAAAPPSKAAAFGSAVDLAHSDSNVGKAAAAAAAPPTIQEVS